MNNIDFNKRRQHACELLNGAALLVFSQPQAYRNSTVNHSYRQDSFLYYLTGFVEPQSALLLCPDEKGQYKSYMFLQTKDPSMEQWNGLRLGVEKAPQTLQVDFAYDVEKMWTMLPMLLKVCSKLFVDLSHDHGYTKNTIGALITLKSLTKKSRNTLIDICDSKIISNQMRIIKGPEEIERMQKAADITAAGFARVYSQVRAGMNEKQVYAILMEAFLQNGADMEAYQTIVAAGKNACILHYIENNKVMNKGDLLLIDAGAQFEYYASDVTRTFPVEGGFTSQQKELYQGVLRAQKSCIELAQVGQNLDAIHDHACKLLSETLIELKILPHSLDEVLEKKLFRKFYPHGTSHWLGMDVHDVGEYQRFLDQSHVLMIENNKMESVPFRENMVFTIEPGLYIWGDDMVDHPFYGIGIRIEDDIVIRKDGPLVLTRAIKKELADFC